MIFINCRALSSEAVAMTDRAPALLAASIRTLFRDCAMPIITDVAVAACCTEFAIWLMSARSGGVVYEGQSHQLNPNWEVMSPDRNHLTKYVILHLNAESDI
jgi:hypothetical protein